MNLENHRNRHSERSEESQPVPAVRSLHSLRLVGMTVLVALLVGETQAQAADFSKAQKVYVPPTRIQRRLDFTSLREHEASAGQYSSSAPTAVYTPAAASLPVVTTKSKPSKSGLVPPPPPFAPSLPPAGHGSVTVPPPPQATPLVAEVRQPAQQVTKPVAMTAASRPSAQETSYLAASRARAQELIIQGKLEEADSLLRSLYKASPKDALVQNDLVNLSMDRSRKFLAGKDTESALKAAREAVYVDPSSNKASSLLDQVIRDSGVNPADSLERLRMADVLSTQGRSTAAIVEYRAALKLKPSAAAHIGLGNIALRNGQKSLAKSEYQQAIETDPNAAPAYRQMGIFRQSSGDTVGANTDLSRAVILDPQDKVAGKALVELWQRQVAKAPSDANARLGLARAYQLAGDLRSAQAEYKQVVRIDPDHPNLAAARQSFKLALAKQEADRHIQAARTLESQGALPAAHEKVLEALGLNPSDAGARLYLGQILEKMGQYPQARSAYMEVLKDDPNNLAAAQRLKALPAAASTPSPAPGFQTGMIRPGEAQPLPTMPAATLDHVSTLSNFMVPLRNHIMAEKNRVEEVEGHARKALDGIDHNLLGTPGLSSPVGSPKAVAPGVFSPPGTITGSTATAGTLSALTAAALASITGGAAPGSVGTPTLSLPPATGYDTPLPGSASHLLATTSASAPASVPVFTSSYQRMQALEQQNRDLKQQLEQAQRAVQGLQVPATYGQPAVTSQPGSFTRWPAAAWTPGFPPQTARVPQIAPETLPQIAPQTVPRQSAPVPAPAFASASAPVFTAQPATSSGTPLGTFAPVQPAPAVKLELAGVKPSAKDIRLQVVLKNNTDSVLPLPSKPIAIFRCATAPDTPVKVSFPLKAVPAHSELHGTIKIPRQQLDPSADVFIPDLLPSGTAYRNVHLTPATPDSVGAGPTRPAGS